MTDNGSSNDEEGGTRREVRIWVESDADAAKIRVVLEAIGFAVLRDVGDGEATLIRWAVENLHNRYRLTAREQDIVEGILAGQRNAQMAKTLGISQATVKWHLHNIFTKTEVQDRESLLRLILQLGRVRDPDGSGDA
ncbi:putative transcriptional regulator [Plesiocystis pacifica SIR-1]|uniref:Putative transcriptional regulator n=1 Tax=Plesiocystis pacifica SIR-1 TaxID=391625 RepID=A6G654_9BACT|nr:helix-turn-helix transcriptional regulator [Plesiocystis pacifica]EDM78656.1 putative transcriptional regulator [Plesiocystis pacifica SIR-1]